MTNRWLLITCCALLPAAPALARAEGFELIPKWELEVGSWFAGSDTNIRFDASDGDRGTELDLEDALGLDENDTVLRLSVARRLGRRHQVRVRHTEFSRSGSRDVPFEIQFGDVVFPINARVDTTWDFTFADLGYTCFFALKENTAWGAHLALVSWDFDIVLSASDPRFPRAIESSVDIDELVPEIGLVVRHAFSPKWHLHSSLTGLQANLGGEKVDVLSGLLRFDYRAFKNAGFSVAGTFSRVNYEDSRGLFVGDYDYEVNGVQVFIPIYFG